MENLQIYFKPFQENFKSLSINAENMNCNFPLTNGITFIRVKVSKCISQEF